MSSAAQSRLSALDGVRALAVLAVIAFHAFPSLAPGGFAGVDVFFVLSGYLITGGLLQRRGSPHAGLGAGPHAGLGGFWARRALRLLPALTLLVLGVGTLVCLYGGDAAVGFGGQVASALLFVTNWHLIADGNSYFTQASPPVLQHLWSLAVEEQFYLVWPLALLVLTRLARRRRTRAAIVGGAAVASAALMVVLAAAGHVGRAYYGSDSHAFGLLAGATLAIIADGRQPTLLSSARAGAAGVVAVLALLLCFRVLWGTDTGTYVVGLPAVVGLTLLLIELARRDSGLLRRTLGARPLAAIGVRSYGLYLWHWPLLVVLRDSYPSLAIDHGTLLGVIAVVLTAAVAWASYALVEAPLLRLGLGGYTRMLWLRLQALGPKQPWAASGIACLLVATSMMTLSAATSAPAQTLLESQIAAGQQAIAEAGYDAGPLAAPAQADAAKQMRSMPKASTSTTTRATRGAGKSATKRARTAKPVVRPAPLPEPWNHMPTGREMDAIGDSVMLASAPALLHRFPGIAIDAVVSRQASTAPGIVAALQRAHRLRPVIVIGLGTNGLLGDGTLAAIRRAAGPDHELVFVNVFEARSWEHAVNTDLATYVAHDPHSMLVDWHDAISGHVDELDDDGIHPGPAGAARYAATLAAALQRLAGGVSVSAARAPR